MKGKTKSSRILIITGVLIVSGILIAIGSGCTGLWGGYGGCFGGYKCGHQHGWGYHCGDKGGDCGCQNNCGDCQPKLRITSSYGCGGGVFVNKGGLPIVEPERPDCDTITSALSAPVGMDISKQSGVPAALPIETPEPVSPQNTYGLPEPVLPTIP